MKPFLIKADILAFLWMSCVVTGALVQLQNGLLGDVLVSLPLQKAAYALALIFLVFSRSKIEIPRWFLKLWLICASAFFATLICGMIFGLQSIAIIVQFIGSYLFFLVLPAAISQRRGFCEATEKQFNLAFAPLVALGAAQYVYNDAIVSTGGPGVGFQVMSWDFYGQVRAFSLFLSSLDFGYFICIAGSYYFLKFLTSRRSKRLLPLAGLGMSCWAIYISSTRLAMILFGMSLLSAVFCAYRSRLLLYGAPFLYLSVGVTVAIGSTGAAGSSNFTTFGNLASDDSLLMRLAFWKSTWETWSSAGFAAIIFGTGASQGAANPELIIDNVYLNTLLQSGVIGLSALVLAIAGIWTLLVRAVPFERSPFALAITAFCSTALMGFMLNTNQFAYLLISFPAAAAAVNTLSDRRRLLTQHHVGRPSREYGDRSYA